MLLSLLGFLNKNNKIFYIIAIVVAIVFFGWLLQYNIAERARLEQEQIRLREIIEQQSNQLSLMQDLQRMRENSSTALIERNRELRRESERAERVVTEFEDRESSLLLRRTIEILREMR